MKLVWTKDAQKRFYDIADYIQRRFGESAKNSFATKTKDFTRLLIEFPEIGTLEVPGKNIRGFQLTRQTRVFYRLKGEAITLLTFFDSRQHPKKRPV